MLILGLSVLGPRDLTGLTFMLSFPGDIFALFLFMPVVELMGWRESHWLVSLTFGVAAVAAGYLQWFVVGPAVAQRMRQWLPLRAFAPLVRVSVVLLFLGLGALGCEMVRAQGQEELFRSRAVTIREDMALEQVRSILGEPTQVVEGPDAVQSLACSRGDAYHQRLYSYEHRWLPERLWRSSFVLAVCSDAKGKVVGRSTIDVH